MRPLNILIACEFTGTVRDAFIARGHNAISCDLLPCEVAGPHIQGDILSLLWSSVGKWDLMIAHPPCTHLSSSGARWFKDKQKEQVAALNFVSLLLAAPIPHIALENPVGVISSKIRKPSQYVQPWEYGHGETKKTGFWLKGLPLLQPTDVVEGREARVHKMPPGPNRGLERSRFYPGIAKAMADQWGDYIQDELKEAA